jgi:hypothetical protein
VKKCIFTLNLNPEQYLPITDLTYPLIRRYADKIQADFRIISERKFPEWTTTYEKLQVYELGKEYDWSMFIDCDALVHPDTFDFTEHIGKDTVLHNANDMANVRFRYDRFFRRDGRNIGSPTWLCLASDWCRELYKPLDDLAPEEAYANIFPVASETLAGIEPSRLIEDYVMSRNIAKYGLKFATIEGVLKEMGCPGFDLFFHLYGISIEQKVRELRGCLERWRLL